MPVRGAAIEEETLYGFKKKSPPPFSPYEHYGVAEFLNLDSDLWVFRRFGKLHLFNILCMQHRLAELEHQLEMQLSMEQERNLDTLLPKIRLALKEYDDALFAQAKLKSYREPDDQVIDHFKEWVAENGKTNGAPLEYGLNIPRQDCLDVKRYGDLASIAGLEKTWTHRFIDRHGCLRTQFQKKTSREEKQLLKNWSTLIYSEESVRRAEAVALHASFCILLVCPVIALSYLSSKLWKLVILVLFLSVASLLSAGFLNTPNKSGLALVAGYAAILVVFLSNNVGS